MRLRWLVPVSAWLGCYAPPPAPLSLELEPSEPEVAAAPARPPGPAKKLRLEISLPGHAVLEVGEPLIIDAVIRNVSPDPQAIVMPGDGSISGMREPHISYVGEIDRGDGRRAPLGPPAFLGACGNFDETWHDEIVTIPPGGVQPLTGWIGSPGEMLAMPRPGRVYLTMRYAYTAGGGSSGFDPGAMGTTPAFELQSNALQIQLTQPLALTVRSRLEPAVDRARATRFEQVYQLEVHNNTDGPRELPAFDSAELRVPAAHGQFERYSFERRFGRRAHKRARALPITIPPRTTVVLPELAAFGFPWERAWADSGRDASMTIHGDGWGHGAVVGMDGFNEGYAR